MNSNEMKWDKEGIKEMILKFNEDPLRFIVGDSPQTSPTQGVAVLSPEYERGILSHKIEMKVPSPSKSVLEFYEVENKFLFDEDEKIKEATSSCNTLWVKPENVNMENIRGLASYIADHFGLITKHPRTGKDILGAIMYEEVHSGHIIFQNNRLFAPTLDLGENVEAYAKSITNVFLAAKKLDYAVHGGAASAFSESLELKLR